jgi:hypothetical protein
MFNFNGTQVRSSPRDVEVSFLIRLFNTLALVGMRPPLEREYLPWQSFLQGLEHHLHIFSTHMQMINTLRHVYEVSSIKKEVAFKDAFNANVESLCLQNELHQA